MPQSLILGSTVSKVQNTENTKPISHSKKGYGHEKASKEEHEDKISCSASERTLLQHTTIPVSATLKLKTSWT